MESRGKEERIGEKELTRSVRHELSYRLKEGMVVDFKEEGMREKIISR